MEEVISKNKLLLSSNNDPKYGIQKENYEKAISTDDLGVLDYHLAKVFNSNSTAHLMRRSEYVTYNMGLSNRSEVFEEEFYDFNDNDDIELITSFCDQIIQYAYQYCHKTADKYKVLNYLAFTLVNEELDGYYLGNHLTLSLLMSELQGFKVIGKKLKYTDISSCISRFRLIESKDKFEEIIAVMRKFVWKSN